MHTEAKYYQYNEVHDKQHQDGQHQDRQTQATQDQARQNQARQDQARRDQARPDRSCCFWKPPPANVLYVIRHYTLICPSLDCVFPHPPTNVDDPLVTHTHPEVIAASCQDRFVGMELLLPGNQRDITEQAVLPLLVECREHGVLVAL